MIYETRSEILRWGIILGLSVLVVALILRFSGVPVPQLEMAGLLIIIATPISFLLLIMGEHLLAGDRRITLLALLTLVMLVLSAIVSLTR
ncbi:MAG: hypothetical protein J7J65_04680 [Candidatus Korarchaeota archaeon]|nr:hypothetical protein [Candidatus Korarchaeota archaeon]